MTWWDIYERARVECAQVVPSSKLTSRLGLTWASEAQNLLQSMSNAVKCHTSVTLNGSDNYRLPKRVKVVDKLHYNPGTDGAVGFRNVVDVPEELFDYIKDHWSGAWGDQASELSDASINTNNLYVSFCDNVMNVHPADPAMTGTIEVRYKPHLAQYSPSDVVEWAGYGESPDAKMKLNGPERQMTPAIPGIICYVKAQLIMNQPDIRKYDSLINRWMGIFEQSARLIAKDNSQYSKNISAKPYLAGTF